MKNQPRYVRIGAPRKNSDGEWRVGVIIDGRDSEPNAYYTDDRDDALSTRKAMLEHFDARPGYEVVR